MNQFDVRAWVFWLITAAIVVIFTRNPLYLVLLLLTARLVMATCMMPEAGQWRLPFWRLAATILLFSTLFNLLTAHVGNNVLFSLPDQWPLIGGLFTIEAAVYGFISGLNLVVLLSLFITFNAVVPVSRLTRLVPTAFHELGLVLVVAITYVPETTRQYQRIREAQAIRGHRLKGVRDLRPIIIPLLVGGLERAYNLAETMVARGYGSTTQKGLSTQNQVMLFLGLGLLLAGLLRLVWQAVDGWLWILLGGFVIGWVLFQISRGVKRTYYRPNRWTWKDTLIVLSSGISFLLMMGLSLGLDRAILGFTPYPQLFPPNFDVRVALGLSGFALPAILAYLP